MSDINQEKLVKEKPIKVSIKGIQKILFQMENCMCKIDLENGKIGIGYLCKIPFHNNNNLLPVLITNYNTLNKNNKILSFTINNELKKIVIDKSRKKYINIDKNIIIIEIKPNKDKIYNYLEFDEIYIYKNKEKFEYNNKLIYIINYQNEELNVLYGLINDIIDNQEIEYGSIILSLETFKIIGIYVENLNNYNINYCIFIKNLIDEFNKYKKEINIIYKTYEEGDENIFGYKFVQNNKNNIELIINENKNELIYRCKLKKGENNIKIIIKNKLINLEYMFYNCISLKNIKELEYLDTRDINIFSFMFSGCSSLSDIKGLENWNVSNGKCFNSMFSGCSSLSDIKVLQKWNVSNGKYFYSMFYNCSSLSNISGLQKWNVTNGNYFCSMFSGCSSLSDIKGLENWNVSNGIDFNSMFYKCSSLLDIKILQNWNVTNGKDFSYMFSGCSSLSNIDGLHNWNVTNGKDFNSMFSGCSSLSNIKALQNWNLSNGNYFSSMFP